MATKPTTKKAGAKKGAKKRRDWKPLFLEWFAKTGNVSLSAQKAKVNRQHVYTARESDEAFATAWDEAEEVAVDALEEEARRRAHDGWDEPVFYKGEQAGTIRKYDSTLLIFLLKARRPQTYRENTRVENFNFDPSELTDEQLERIAGGEHPLVVLAATRERPA
jgi:hypothetical protein